MTGRFRINLRIVLLLALLVLEVLPAIAQKKQFIYWDANRPLTWADFRGPKPKKVKKRFVAVTYSGLRYRFRKDSSGKIRFAIVSYFDPTKSWKKRRQPGTELLNHEQTHFNITELYARRTRQTVLEYLASH